MSKRKSKPQPLETQREIIERVTSETAANRTYVERLRAQVREYERKASKQNSYKSLDLNEGNVSESAQLQPEKQPFANNQPEQQQIAGNTEGDSTCWSCNRKFSATGIGTRIKCPHCGKSNFIPGSSGGLSVKELGQNVTDNRKKFITCQCPHCSGQITFEPEHAGAVSQCPHCQTNILLTNDEPPRKSPDFKLIRNGDGKAAWLFWLVLVLVPLFAVVGYIKYASNEIAADSKGIRERWRIAEQRTQEQEQEQEQQEQEWAQNTAPDGWLYKSLKKIVDQQFGQEKDFTLVHKQGNGYAMTYILPSQLRFETTVIGGNVAGLNLVENKSEQATIQNSTNNSPDDETGSIQSIRLGVWDDVDKWFRDKQASSFRVQSVNLTSVGNGTYKAIVDVQGEVLIENEITYDGRNVTMHTNSATTMLPMDKTWEAELDRRQHPELYYQPPQSETKIPSETTSSPSSIETSTSGHDGYWWNSASEQEKREYCKSLAFTSPDKTADDFYNAIDDFYNTQDPQELKTPLSTIATYTMLYHPQQ